MVPMPYILVNIVLDYLSFALLCVTSAMLLYRRFATSRPRSAPGIVRRVLSVAALALLIALLAWAVSFALKHYGHLSRITLFDFCFYAGTFNAVVLAYGFMSRRWFLNRPRALRRLLLAALSVIATLVPITLIATVVTALFVIK